MQWENPSEQHHEHGWSGMLVGIGRVWAPEGCAGWYRPGVFMLRERVFAKTRTVLHTFGYHPPTPPIVAVAASWAVAGDVGVRVRIDVQHGWLWRWDGLSGWGFLAMGRLILGPASCVSSASDAVRHRPRCGWGVSPHL